MRAAVYVRFSTVEGAQNGQMKYKDQAMEYCKENGYDLLAVIEVIGQGGAINHLRHQSVKKLINKKMIDVLVVPELRMISRSIPEVVQSLDYLKKFGIEVECAGRDPLEHTILQVYREATDKPGKRRAASPDAIDYLLCGIGDGKAR